MHGELKNCTKIFRRRGSEKKPYLTFIFHSLTEKIPFKFTTKKIHNVNSCDLTMEEKKNGTFIFAQS